MPQPLHVLMVEDNPLDAELVLRTLRKAGFEPSWVRVDNEQAFMAQVREPFDVVLSDHSMPQFGSRRALELLKQHNPEVPFIVVSGTIGEESAVEAMRCGAADYLMKDRLSRLGSAVLHALSQARLRRESRRTVEELTLFRKLMDHSNDGFEVLDPATGRFIDVNATGAAMTGYTRDELLELKLFDIDPTIPETSWPLIADEIRARGSFSGEGVHRRKDGSEFPVEVNAVWVSLDRDYFVTVVRDISVRKKAEASLRESEERFRELADTIHEVFWIADVEKGFFHYASPAFEETWRRTREALYADPGLWRESIHPEDRERVVGASARAAAEYPEGSYDEEFRILRPDGSERWVRERGFAIKRAPGEPQRMAGVVEDVTERKALQAQFLRAQRMEAIGSLAGGMAHDLNNILAPMLIVPALLRDSIKGEHDRQLLDLIEKGARRGSHVIRQLLTFSRGTAGARILVQLRHLAKEMVEIMRETFPKDITVEIHARHDLRPVLGDPTQLHQVLMNLCVNARDAMPSGGVLRLSLSHVELGEKDVAGHANVRTGPHVALSVEDTGQGIAADIIDRIFEPFFTTKDASKGTGLGLSTVLGIVRSHNGFITVASPPEGGARFTLFLPEAADGADPMDDPAAESPRRGRGETVLVVDDEEPIRIAMRSVLERFGYRVLTARDGADGLDVYLKQRDAIRIVLSDVAMPVMGGVPLARALRIMSSSVKIVAISGLCDASCQEDLLKAGVDMILSKPCNTQELLEVISSLLSSPS